MRARKSKDTINVFKTYRFEIHNISQAKLKKLLQTFKQADMLYYKALERCEQDAKNMLLLETKAERTNALKEIQLKLQHIVRPIPYGNALKASVIEMAKAQISSFVELTLSGQDASYPSKLTLEYDYNEWLNVLIQSASLELESAARDAMATLEKSKHRPLTFEKYRLSDGFMILSDDKNRLFAFLNLWTAKDKRATPLNLDMIDTRDGSEFKHKTSTGMLLPLEFSPTSRAALQNGQAKSAKLVLTKDNRLYLMVSVLFEVEKREPKLVMGIDQGFKELATYAVRDPETGKVIKSGSFSGQALKAHQQKLEASQRLNQRLGRTFIKGWTNYTTNLMHNIANEIVKIADEFQAQVVIEDLSGIKNGPQHKRPFNGPKNNLRRMLTRQQFGRLEFMLNYKLQCVGLPGPKTVWPNNTSITCPRCGNIDKANRDDRSFECTQCHHTEHADIIGAINVAGSHICFERIKSRLKKGQRRPEGLRYNNWLVENLTL